MPTQVPTIDEFNALADRVTKLEQGPPPVTGPTPDGTYITAPNTKIIDDVGNAYEITTGAQIAKNAQVDINTQRVVKIGMNKRMCVQQNQDNNWWQDVNNSSKTNITAWRQIADPTAPIGQGMYHVANGQLLGPDGQVFKLKGVNVCATRVWGDKGVEHTRVTRQKLQALFPKVNFIRYAHWAGMLLDPADPGIMAWTKDMTDHGIVVCYDLHYTGQAINPNDATANNWLAKCAQTYKDNPMVWGQSQNEPHGNAYAISGMMNGQYNAWRNTGNTNPFFSCCGDPGGELTGMNPHDFEAMSNFLFDLHYYGWMPANGMSYQSCVNQLSGFRSQDGAIPVVCIEYGDATDGNNIDNNWQTVLDQALNWPQGSAAWMINWITATSSTGDCLVTDYNMSGRTPYGSYVNDRF